MATDPDARLISIGYRGGTARLPYGLFKYIFGDVPLRWEAPVDVIDSLTGRKRFKYGRRQASLSAGGKEIIITLDNGEDWTVRTTGEDNEFIDEVLSRSQDGKVVEIRTRRGTVYAPQFPAPVVP